MAKGAQSRQDEDILRDWGSGKIKSHDGEGLMVVSDNIVHCMEEGLDLSCVVSGNKLRITYEI